MTSKRRITAELRIGIESESGLLTEEIVNALVDEIKFWCPTVPVQNLVAGAVTQVSVVRFDEQPQSPEVA